MTKRDFALIIAGVIVLSALNAAALCYVASRCDAVLKP